MNKLTICKEFGYTEDEYDSNSIEFNIAAMYLLEAESKANKAHTGNIPRPKSHKIPRVSTNIKR